MNPRRLRSRTAFTLVELLVGATLSAAIMAAVLSSYIYLGRGLARLANQQTLETEARRTLAYFTQDVQAASGISGTPSVSSVTLIVPAGGGTTTVAYTYDNSADTFTRTPAGGTAVVLLRNISDGGPTTNFDLFLRYYDAAGNAYDGGGYPYTTTVNYSAGIKQMSLQFCTQTGNNSNGTQTRLHWAASGRVVLRNKGLLP